uniref:BBS1 domain-containing protein n=1 Tax=Panagrellus redivivus TaxID=6233 RepID=A0A7E4V3X9_PANRE
MAFNSDERRWVRALWEPALNIETIKQNIAVGNFSSGEASLIVVDSPYGAAKRLVHMKGLTLASDVALPSEPVGIVPFVVDNGVAPCVAVAIQSSLLVYRNMRPYYRYNIPFSEGEDLPPGEAYLWEQAVVKEAIDAEKLNQNLTEIRLSNGILKMSFQSQFFLTSTPQIQAMILAEAIETYKNLGKRPTLNNVTITCLTTMKKDASVDEVDVLVIGTDLGKIYFVDGQTYQLLEKIQLPPDFTPYKLITAGEFMEDSEFHLFVICRGREEVLLLTKSSNNGIHVKKEIYLKSFVVTAVVTKMKHIVFGTRDQRLLWYNLKGKKQKELQLTDRIIDMEVFYHDARNYSGILIAFPQKVEIHLEPSYMCLDTLKIFEESHIQSISWIKYGKYGREPEVLLVGFGLPVDKCSDNSGMAIYMFRRTATLEAVGIVGPPVPKRKLQIPKRTKVFVENAEREINNAKHMHASYQRDMFLLRLKITKEYHNLSLQSHGAVPMSSEAEAFDISLDINGFGPSFLINIKLRANAEMPEKPTKRYFVFKYDHSLYHFDYTIIPVPDILHQNNEITFANNVKCLNPEKDLRGDVKVYLINALKRPPVWQTSFEMPLSEKPQ